jgi:hypothetical protein
MSQPLNLLRPQAAPLRGWLLFGVGLLVFAATAVYRWRDEAEQLARIELQQQAELKLLEAAKEQEQAALARQPTPKSKVHESAVRQARMQPWEAALRAVEVSAREPLYLLALEMDAQEGRLHLDVMAPTLGETLKFATQLGHQPALRAVQIQSQEPLLSQAGRTEGVRVRLAASWGLRP